MRRRPSGSTEEDDTDEASLSPDPQAQEDDGRKRSFTSAKFDVARNSVTLDRRKVEKSLAPTQLTQQTWSSEPNVYTEPEKQKLVTGGSPDRSPLDKMKDSKARPSRMRSPWRYSLLVIFTAAIAGGLVFLIVHSLLTRQLDTQGCAMSYMDPAYARLSEFDTEHTRFASKYSLYLYREVGVDEDTRVGMPGDFPCSFLLTFA